MLSTARSETRLAARSTPVNARIPAARCWALLGVAIVVCWQAVRRGTSWDLPKSPTSFGLETRSPVADTPIPNFGAFVKLRGSSCGRPAILSELSGQRLCQPPVRGTEGQTDSARRTGPASSVRARACRERWPDDRSGRRHPQAVNPSGRPPPRPPRRRSGGARPRQLRPDAGQSA